MLFVRFCFGFDTFPCAFSVLISLHDSLLPKHSQKGMVILFIDVFIPGAFEQCSYEGVSNCIMLLKLTIFANYEIL